jgi:hypothetical protein
LSALALINCNYTERIDIDTVDYLSKNIHEEWNLLACCLINFKICLVYPNRALLIICVLDAIHFVYVTLSTFEVVVFSSSPYP